MAPRGKRKTGSAPGGAAGRPKKNCTKACEKVIVKKAKDRKELIRWISDSIEDKDDEAFLTSPLSIDSNDVYVSTGEIHEVLWIAAKHGHVKTCEILFEQLNSRGKKKYLGKKFTAYDTSPLHEAAGNGQLKVTRFFIEKLKFDVNQLDKYGYPPLYYATNFKYLEATGVTVKLVRFLLEEGAQPNLVTVDPENVDRYPLYRAMQGEHENDVHAEQIIRLLLAYGADPNCNRKYENIPDDDTRTPIRRLLAIETVLLNGKSKIVDILLQHGAFLMRGCSHIIWPTHGTVLNQFFVNSHRVRIWNESVLPTPKMKRSICRVLAQHAKSNETVAQFLRFSLVNMTDKESCKILLHAGMNPVLAMNYAIEKRKNRTCKWLLDLGVDPFDGSSICTNDNQHVPLPFQAAARLTDTSILELFMSHWNKRFAANSGKNDNGDYPIHLLCCDPKVTLPAVKLVAECQSHTLAVVDGEESLFPFHFAAMWDAELDVIYTVLRHCPDAALVRH